MNDKKYGWFSAKSKALGHPTHIWRTLDGKEVEICQVSGDKDYPDFVWPDRECLGEVTSFVRQGQVDSVYN